MDIPLGVGAAIPAPPGSYSLANSSAVSYEDAYQFDYTIKNGTITTTLVGGSYTRTFLSGFRNGETATFDVLSYVGYVPANELVLANNGTYIKTETYSTGEVPPQVCTSSTHGYRLNQLITP